MKILGRICVILLAALVVVGVTFAVSRTTSATSTNAGFSRGAAQGQNSGPPAQGNGSFRGGERRDGGGGGLFSLFDIGKNLVIIAVIVAIVAPTSAWISKRKQRATVKQQAPPDPTLST